MRFAWEWPDKWLWVHVAAPLAGAITDGTINVIVEDGVAVLVTDEGGVITAHRLTNLLQPRNYDFEGSELGPVTGGTHIGRQAWFFTAQSSKPGRRPHEVVFDADSGVLLCMRSEDSYLGFEELELDVDIPADTFRWSGPVAARKIGHASVVPDDDGTFMILREVSVRGRPMFYQNGPGGLSRNDAIAWGEERAALTKVRGE